MTFPVPKVDGVDATFPTRIEWIPSMGAIPESFKNPTYHSRTKPERFFKALFYHGLVGDRLGMLPVEGVVAKDAWNALNQVARTFGIPHEHKEAAFTYLCSEWFRDLRWKARDGEEVPFDNAELEAEWRRKNQPPKPKQQTSKRKK